VKKISTVAKRGNEIFKEPKLTIGLDLGDRTSHYCILDERGETDFGRPPADNSEGNPASLQQGPAQSNGAGNRNPGTHSPWVSRQLTQMGHEVIVAHARNVRLIGQSSRKDDQLDARTLARLARIDPALLGPVQHRSAKAQIHLTVIRARAALVSTRTALVNAARGLTKSYGERLRKCGSGQMSREIAKGLSQELRDALEPLLEEIESLNERIAETIGGSSKSPRKCIPRLLCSNK
jgi:transposase